MEEVAQEAQLDGVVIHEENLERLVAHRDGKGHCVHLSVGPDRGVSPLVLGRGLSMGCWDKENLTS